MKMKNVLVGVLLGLLTVVRTTPINTVTQTPTKAEDEVLREAVTDGFLVDHFFPSTLATKSPESNTSKSPAQQHTSSDPEKVAIDEASGESTTSALIGDHTATTVSSKSTFSSSNAPTSQSPQSSFTSSSLPNEAHSSATPRHVLVSQTTDPAVPSFNFLSTQSSESGSGSGDGEDNDLMSSVTSISSTESSTASSTSMFAEVGDFDGSGSGMTTETSTASTTFTTATWLFSEPEGLGSGSDTTVEITTMKKTIIIKQEAPASPAKVKDHVTILSPRQSGSTPSWIIILGFIVGVAALVLLCVAIATRDKWNGPNQVSQPEKKSDFSNQQRELEMETFLHKEEPRENGKAAEYTVIPLDELPESSLSH